MLSLTLSVVLAMALLVDIYAVDPKPACEACGRRVPLDEYYTCCGHCSDCCNDTFDQYCETCGGLACSEKGVCVECGEPQAQCPCVPTCLTHTYGDWTVIISATCTSDGKEQRICTKCGTDDNRKINALGHDYVTSIHDATCTEAGYEHEECTRCGDYTDRTTEPALGHNWQTTIVTAPTCSAEGETVEECSRCHEKTTSTTPTIDHNFKTETVKFPTCTEKGSKRTYCTNCSYETYSDIAIDPTAHSFDAYTSDGNRTCKSAGTVTARCEHGCGATDTIANPNGVSDHFYSGAHSETIREGDCKNPAQYKVYCDYDCGNYRIETGSITTAHKFGAEEVITAPTETTTGVSKRTCTVCGYVDRYTTDKIPHQHKYVVPPSGTSLTQRSAATCTAKATYYKVCACGAVSTTEYFEAGELAEHSYNLTETHPDDILATCKNTGKKTKTCTVCKKVTVETLPKIDHIFEAEEKDGKTIYKCTMCSIIRVEGVDEDKAGNIIYAVIDGLFDGSTKMYDTITSGLAINGVTLETAIVTVLMFIVVIFGIFIIIKAVL